MRDTEPFEKEAAEPSSGRKSFTEKRGRLVQVPFYYDGSNTRLEYYDNVPLGSLLNRYCEQFHFDRGQVSFQVWEQVVEASATWAQLQSKHRNTDLLIDVEWMCGC